MWLRNQPLFFLLFVVVSSDVQADPHLCQVLIFDPEQVVRLNHPGAYVQNLEVGGQRFSGEVIASPPGAPRGHVHIRDASGNVRSVRVDDIDFGTLRTADFSQLRDGARLEEIVIDGHRVSGTIRGGREVDEHGRVFVELVEDGGDGITNRVYLNELDSRARVTPPSAQPRVPHAQGPPPPPPPPPIPQTQIPAQPLPEAPPWATRRPVPGASTPRDRRGVLMNRYLDRFTSGQAHTMSEADQLELMGRPLVREQLERAARSRGVPFEGVPSDELLERLNSVEDTWLQRPRAVAQPAPHAPPARPQRVAATIVPPAELRRPLPPGVSASEREGFLMDRYLHRFTSDAGTQMDSARRAGILEQPYARSQLERIADRLGVGHAGVNSHELLERIYAADDDWFRMQLEARVPSPQAPRQARLAAMSEGELAQQPLQDQIHERSRRRYMRFTQSQAAVANGDAQRVLDQSGVLSEPASVELSAYASRLPNPQDRRIQVVPRRIIPRPAPRVPRGQLRGSPVGLAYSHPEFNQMVQEAEELGYRVVVDPAYDLEAGMPSSQGGLSQRRRVIALGSGAHHTVFVHELQHARFTRFIERVLQGELSDQSLIRAARSSMSPADRALFNEVNALWQSGIQSRIAIDETIAVQRQLDDLLAAGYGARSPEYLRYRAYALRHQTTELANMTRTPVQERAYQRALSELNSIEAQSRAVSH